MMYRKIYIAGFLLFCFAHAQAAPKQTEEIKPIPPIIRVWKRIGNFFSKKAAVVVAKNVEYSERIKLIKDKKFKAKKVSAPVSGKREVRFAGFYNSLEWGFLKYRKEKGITLRDAAKNGGSSLSGSGNQDTITMVKTSPIFLLGFSTGLEFKNLPSFQKGKKTNGRLGLATSFAKKNDAVESDYFDGNATTTNLAVLQDVKRFEGLVVGEYDIYKKYNITYSLDAGLGFVVGALRDIRIYEKNGNARYYTGSRLKAKKTRVTGRIGASLEKQFK